MKKTEEFGMGEFIGLVIFALLVFFLVKGVGNLLNGVGSESCSRYGNIQYSVLQGCKVYVEGKGYVPEAIYLRQYEQNININ